MNSPGSTIKNGSAIELEISTPPSQACNVYDEDRHWKEPSPTALVFRKLHSKESNANLTRQGQIHGEDSDREAEISYTGEAKTQNAADDATNSADDNASDYDRLFEVTRRLWSSVMDNIFFFPADYRL